MALKSDNGNLLFQRLIMLLRLNMVLVQKNAYMRSIMMQLLNLMHQKQHNLPSWQMFSKSTAVFNEEVGETSFSILSRLVLGDTTKCSFEHIDLMYGLIHTYRANNADMTGDQLRKTRPNKRYRLDKKQETAEAILAFMQHTIRAIKANTYRIYPGKPDKHNRSYKGADEASTVKVERTELLTKWERAALVHLDTQVDVMKKHARATYFGHWAGTNCIEQWPEMKSFIPAAEPYRMPAAMHFPDDDIAESSAGEDDEDVIAEISEDDYHSDNSTKGSKVSSSASSKASSDEDVPKEGPAPYDPYTDDLGDGDTAEPEEEKAPARPLSRRSRPAIGLAKGRGGKRGKSGK